MIKSYFITFFRKLRREKLFSMLNIGGLTVGLATVILISLFIRDELSYDQFESKKDSVFLLWHEVGQNARADVRVPYRLAHELKEAIPAFEEVVSTVSRALLVSSGDKSFYNNKTLYVTPGVFELFDINVLNGDYAELERPDVAMISQAAAVKYYGKAEDAVGKTIKVDDKRTYLVTGVYEDRPSNASLQFDFMLSGKSYFDTTSKQIDSERGYFPTTNWVLMQPGYDMDQVSEQMASLIEDSMFEWLYGLSGIEQPFHLLNLVDVHLRSGLDLSDLNNSDIRYVYLFTAIGALILLIAIINYTNLATAQSIKKAKEVGLRKVVGASTFQVSRYYLLESFILVFISSLLAFATAERCLPYMNRLMGKEVSLNYFSLEFLVVTFGITIFIGVFAGMYPAFVLSKSKPLDALQKKLSYRSGVKKGLIITQFFIAQLLIIATIIIQQQLSFIQNKNLGYDQEHLIEINAHNELGKNAQVFKSELMRMPGVNSVSLSRNTIDRQDITFLDNSNIESDQEVSVVLDFLNVDHDFLKTMEMEVVAGRDFRAGDSKGVVINQSAMTKFGWDNFEGKVIKLWGDEFPVLGVIRDYHGQSLKDEISASAIAVADEVSSYAVIRLNGSNIRETMSSIEEIWNGFDTGRPLDYKFYDADVNSKYERETRLGSLFLSFSGLAIFIALLGLIGLSTFTIEQRVKEISLRRVLGASFNQVFRLFAKGYLAMTFVAFLVAAPIVYYSISGWLQQFVYRIEPGFIEFSVALMVTTLLVIIIISVQVFKTNRSNPAEALRNE